MPLTYADFHELSKTCEKWFGLTVLDAEASTLSGILQPLL